MLRGAEPSDDVPTLMAAADQIGYPVFVKAVAGGGGRGMRRVDDPDDGSDPADRERVGGARGQSDRIPAGQIPYRPGDRIPFGSTASLIFSTKCR